MNSPNSNLLNRLILLVLCLNLVCLVLLVARVYRPPAGQTVQVAPGERDESLEMPKATRPEPAPVPAPRPVQVPTAARSADGLARATSSPLDREELGAAQAMPVVAVVPAPLVPPGTLVNLPSHGDTGIQPVPPRGGNVGLQGRVVLHGTPPPESLIDPGAQCAQAAGRPLTTRHYVVGPDNGLADVLVWLKNAPPAPAIQPSPVLTTVGCMFQPYIMGVVTGQKITVRNLDSMLHNIHATPKNNREFNFAQPARGTSTIGSFGTAELFIRIKCDVHPWELAYVNVLEHPYFSITDTNGTFAIPPGFPPGRYVVGAKHLKTGGKTGELEQEVELRDGEMRQLTFEFVPVTVQAKGR